MTQANKVTLLRMILIPIMIVFMSIDIKIIKVFSQNMDVAHLIASIIFVIAASTDALDGYLARKYNQITTFGKFLDPIADKLLVISAMLYLMLLPKSGVALWAVTIVIFREFVVTGVRLIAVDKGRVIAASSLGKIKTITTMLALIIILFNDFGMPTFIGQTMWYIAVASTLLSGLDYVIKNKSIIFESM